MSRLREVVICHLNVEAWARRSVGVGQTEQSALKDAILHFPDKPLKLVRSATRPGGDAKVSYEQRPLR